LPKTWVFDQKDHLIELLEMEDREELFIIKDPSSDNGIGFHLVYNTIDLK